MKEVKEQELLTSKNLSFEQWLDFFSKEPTSKELDQMQLEDRKRRINYYCQNNPYYQPLQGS